jgi:hypothetical protein
MNIWIVHYEIPPMHGIYTERILATSASKARMHIETIIPESRVIKVE